MDVAPASEQEHPSLETVVANELPEDARIAVAGVQQHGIGILVQRPLDKIEIESLPAINLVIAPSRKDFDAIGRDFGRKSFERGFVENGIIRQHEKLRHGEPAFFQRNRPAEIPELDVAIEDAAAQPESMVGEIYVILRDFRQSGKSDKRHDRPRRYLYQQDLRGVLAQFPVQLFRLLRRGERRGYFEDFDSVAASGQIALDARHCLGTVFEDVEKLDL